MSAPSVDTVVGRSRRSGLLLACVLVFCVLLLSAQAPGARGRGSLLQSWILSVAAPLGGLTSSISRSVSGMADSVAETFTAREENSRLKKELSGKDQELFRLRAQVAQAARERLLLSSGAALPNVLTSAPVLLFDSRAGAQSALIGAGSTSGISQGSPIAVAEGLVGRVVTVGATVSRAQLLLDASAAVGARVARTQDLGVVRGDGQGGMRLNNVSMTSRVQPGDVIESAGIDGVYPRGVVIGRVATVARGSDLFLEIRVTPAVSFSRLTDVLVLAPSPAASSAPGRPGSAGP
ncbi:MAG TPA: rod shape-determining protein MreC [Thermoanaerobaculia bacterium]|nr:rod shape-determining protein MreC [Thermoanaerobaculia bacterium]